MVRWSKANKLTITTLSRWDGVSKSTNKTQADNNGKCSQNLLNLNEINFANELNFYWTARSIRRRWAVAMRGVPDFQNVIRLIWMHLIGPNLCFSDNRTMCCSAFQLHRTNSFRSFDVDLDNPGHTKNWRFSCCSLLLLSILMNSNENSFGKFHFNAWLKQISTRRVLRYVWMIASFTFVDNIVSSKWQSPQPPKSLQTRLAYVMPAVFKILTILDAQCTPQKSWTISLNSNFRTASIFELKNELWKYGKIARNLNGKRRTSTTWLMQLN